MIRPARRVVLLLLVCAIAAMTPTRRALAEQAPWTCLAQPDLGERIETAPDLKIERLPVEPVRSIRVAGVMWAPNPDGRTLDLIQIYYGQNLQRNWIVVLDLGDGTVKATRQPEYVNWHNCWDRCAVVGPDGRLYISTIDSKGRHQLNVYDPGTNEMKLAAFPVPETLIGETHPLLLGPDDKLYMVGAHSNRAASACQIDPKTGKVVDYGPLGPSHAPNACWGYFGACDERYLYIASGKIPWYLLAYDRDTGKTEVLLTTDNTGIVGLWTEWRGDRGVIRVRAVNVIGEKEEKTWGWLKDGKFLRADQNAKPPEEVFIRNPNPPLPPKPEVYLGNAAPTREGDAEIWVRTAEAAAAAATAPPPDADPAALGWKAYRFRIEPHPQFIYRLVELPDGRLFGSAGAYEGNFVYDPKTGDVSHLGKLHLSHYATAIHEGKVYMSGYPTSPVHVYDPARAWNVGLIGAGRPGETPKPETDADANPRLVTRLIDSGAHKMYAAEAGADGRIYFGGRWYRNGNGGGFGWWDPKAEKAGGFWEVFSNYQITHMTTASERRHVVISTRPIRDAVLNKPTPKEGRLFVFDTRAGEIVRTIDPVAGCPGTGLVAGVGGARVLGLTQSGEKEDESILYGVDVETGQVAFRKAIPFALDVKIGSNQQEGFDYRLGPDGCVWTFIHERLVRIHPADARIEVLGNAEFRNWDSGMGGGRIAFVGRDIYLSRYFCPRRIRNIVPPEDAAAP